MLDELKSVPFLTVANSSPISRQAFGLISFLLFCSFVQVGWAQDQSSTEPSHPSAAHEHGHRNHLAVFLGATSGKVHSEGHERSGEETSENETAFSLGLDYQYRFHSRVAIGALYDHAFGKLRSTVVGGGLFFRPAGSLQVLAAPGIDHHEGSTKALFRLGVYYEIEAGSRFSVTPNLNFDFVGGETLFVFGVAFGVGF